MKRMIKASTDDRWTEIQEGLEEDIDAGVYDSLDEMTDAGEALIEICVAVEESLDIQNEPDVRAGHGRMYFYSMDDGSEIAESVDYNEFDDTIIELAVQSDSEEEFKSKYKSYLEGLMY